MDDDVHCTQHHWRLDGSDMEAIFQGASPLTDVEATLETTDEPPPGFPLPAAPERPEEFARGLTPELMQLVEQATALETRSGERHVRPQPAGAAA